MVKFTSHGKTIYLSKDKFSALIVRLQEIKKAKKGDCKMKEVWIVSFVDMYDRGVFTTAEKAYNCIVEQLNYESQFSDDDRRKVLDELAADYSENPEIFGVRDFGWAERIEVDTW